jgi:hypothetical protein
MSARGSVVVAAALVARAIAEGEGRSAGTTAERTAQKVFAGRAPLTQRLPDAHAEAAALQLLTRLHTLPQFVRDDP